MATDTKNLTEEVVAKIQNLIVARNLASEDVFCRESDLESELGVSRTIIREAVSRLRALGILESRQRVGLVVKKPDPVALFGEGMVGELFDEIDLEKLSELRYTLEVGAIDLVVKRATEQQLDKLLSIAEKFAQSLDGEKCDSLSDEIELDFHKSILEASGSPMLMRMHFIITAYFRNYTCESKQLKKENKEKYIWEHRMIAEALKERNGERARCILTQHLKFLIK